MFDWLTLASFATIVSIVVTAALTWLLWRINTPAPGGEGEKDEAGD